jgi:hypothetical protein
MALPGPGGQLGQPGVGGSAPLCVLALGVDRVDDSFPEVVGQDIVLGDVFDADPVGRAWDGFPSPSQSSTGSACISTR